MENSRPLHWVDPNTPIYEETIRALGFVPTPPQEPIVIMAEGTPALAGGLDERTVINAEQIVAISSSEAPARPVGAAAVLAITEPTGVLPRPRKQPVKVNTNTTAPARRKKGGKNA